jgi:protein-S-isoprenylcysteine O-methyltransferase Ste14
MNLLRPATNLIFLGGFIAYLAIRHVHQQRVGKPERVTRRFDGLEKVLLTLVLVGGLLLPVLYLFTPLLNFANYAAPRYLPWAGLPVMVGALCLFHRSHADLGRNWSVSLEVREDHELVTRGVYRRVRHPMYAAIWLFGVAQALFLPNWLAGGGAVVPFALMYVLRVPREERMMLDTFGDVYREYMARTPRLVPRLRAHDA